MIIYKIYIIRNTINDKVYIGQTSSTLQHRFSQHCYIDIKYQTRLQKAMLEFGKENFYISLIESTTKLLVNQRETYFVNFYDSLNNGYNAKHGGSNNTASDYSIKNMSEAQLKRYSNPNYVNPIKGRKNLKLSLATKGVHKSEEHKQKIAAGNTGKKFTEERKNNLSLAQQNMTAEIKAKKARKISEFRIGKTLSEETKEKIRNRIITDEFREKCSKNSTGESNSNCKLTEQDVRNIRLEYKTNLVIKKHKLILYLKNKYNCHETTIRNIINKKLWKNII